MLKLQNFVNSDIFTIQVQHIHMIPISELSVVWMGVNVRMGTMPPLEDI